MAIKVANNQSMTGITALPSAVSGGAWTLLSTQTASSSSTLSFTSGLDSTYDVYCFKFINIHPATDNTHFSVGFRDGSTDYDATKTTSLFYARHKEDGSATALSYDTGNDIAQGTGFQYLYFDTGADNDQAANGYMYLYNPASTTYVKHFMARCTSSGENDWVYDTYCAGYCNVTAAIDAVQFKMSSGNIDAGVIKLYGIS
jgi:hypothetical protein